MDFVTLENLKFFETAEGLLPGGVDLNARMLAQIRDVRGRQVGGWRVQLGKKGTLLFVSLPLPFQNSHTPLPLHNSSQ